MHNPHETLGVASDASESQIRSRYLELVRQHPPDRDPDRFNEIHEAYQRLSDPVSRMERLLFSADRSDTLEGLLAEARSRIRGVRIPAEALLALAKKS
jgi:curved DNA-binding protein CbpA